MISLIIPSKDRPSQLDCFLRSLLRYWDYNDLHIMVIYKYSNAEYKKAYDKVFEEHWHVIQDEEYNFCEQVKKYTLCSCSNVVGFATDDCVVWRKPDIQPDEVQDLFCDSNMHSFSLRLGLNTTVQNYLDGSLQQPLVSYNEIYRDIISWKWKAQPRFQNYGYGFSWDCHWYSKEWLLEAFKVCNTWENPRAAEHQLNTNEYIRNTAKKIMSSCKTSSVFVNTINAVQDDAIPSGTRYNYTPQELNDRFLSGERILLDSFKGKDIIGCHDEVGLSWEVV